GFDATDDPLAERATALINAAPDAIVAGPAPPLASTSGHNPDRAARRYVRRHGRGGIGGIARTPRRQHHGHQFALARTRRQTAGHFNRGGVRRAPDRRGGRVQANPARSPSDPA